MNFVGSVASALFGVLDQEDADRYNSEIIKVKADQNYQNELLQKQTLIMKRLTQSTNTTLADIISRLNNINKSLNELIENNNWSEIKQNFNTIAATLALTLIDHDQITNEIKGILSHTLKGEIIDLIPINQLEDNLYFINDQVAKDEELAIEFKTESVYNIFKTATIHSILRNNIVIIEIGLPILELEEFDIFRSIPIPTKVEQNYVTILPSSNMFITNTEKTQYIPLSDQEFGDCISRDANRVICKQIVPIHNGEDNTCELILLSKPYMKSLPQNCEIRTLPSKNYIIYLHELNKFFCVIETPIQFQTICPNGTEAFKMENSGILEIMNNCYIKNENFIIKSHTVEQYKNNVVINPKFNLSNIMGKRSKKLKGAINEKSEIFIRNHFADFNAIANDISRLQADEDDRKLLENYNGKVENLKISAGSLIMILTFVTMGFIGLKIRKHLSSRKLQPKNSNDIEMQASMFNGQNDNYAEIRREPTPFVRRSLSRTTE